MSDKDIAAKLRTLREQEKVIEAQEDALVEQLGTPPAAPSPAPVPLPVPPVANPPAPPGTVPGTDPRPPAPVPAPEPGTTPPRPVPQPEPAPSAPPGTKPPPVVQPPVVIAPPPIVPTMPGQVVASLVKDRTGAISGAPFTDATGGTWSFGDKDDYWTGDWRVLRNGQPVGEDSYSRWAGHGGVLLYIDGKVWLNNPGHTNTWSCFDGTSFIDSPFGDPRQELHLVHNQRSGAQHATLNDAIAAASPNDTLLVEPGERYFPVVIKQAIKLKSSDPKKRFNLGNIGKQYFNTKGMVYIDNYGHAGPGPMLVEIEDAVLDGKVDPDQHTAGIWPEGADDAGGPGMDIRLSRIAISHHTDGILGGMHLGPKSTFVLNDVEFLECGNNDGLTHNAYFPHALSVELNRVRSVRATIGHLIKSRARRLIMRNCVLLQEDSTSSAIFDAAQGGDVQVYDSVLTKGPNSDNPYYGIFYGREAAAYDHAGYVESFVMQRNLVINFCDNNYSKRWIDLALDEKMIAAGLPFRMGPVDISGNDFAGPQMDRIVALYPNNNLLTLDQIEAYADEKGNKSYRRKLSGGPKPEPKPEPAVLVEPVTKPVSQPSNILIPKWKQGIKRNEWRQAGSNSLLSCAELVASGFNSNPFNAWQGAAFDQRDCAFVGACMSGHDNGAGWNGGWKFPLMMDDPRAILFVPPSLMKDRVYNSDGWYLDGLPNGRHTYGTQFVVKRKLILFGSAAGYGNNNPVSRSCASLDLDTGKWDARGTVPDIPHPVGVDPTLFQDPTTGNVFYAFGDYRSLYVAATNSWIDYSSTGNDKGYTAVAGGTMCLDTRRRRAMHFSSPPGDSGHIGFGYRPLDDLATWVPQTIKGVDYNGQPWGTNGYGVVFDEHEKDKSLDAYLVYNGGASRDVWEINAETFDAVKLVTTGTPPPPVDASGGYSLATYNRWQMAKALKGVVALPRFDAPPWFLARGI